MRQVECSMRGMLSRIGYPSGLGCHVTHLAIHNPKSRSLRYGSSSGLASTWLSLLTALGPCAIPHIVESHLHEFVAAHLQRLLSQHPARNGIMDVMDLIGPKAQHDVETQEELSRDQSNPWPVLFQYQVGEKVYDPSKLSKGKHHQISVSAVSLINVVAEHYSAAVDNVTLEDYLVQEETTAPPCAKKRTVHAHAGDIELSIDGEPMGTGKSLTSALMALAAGIIRTHNPKTAYALRQPWSLSCWETFLWPARFCALREFKKALVTAQLRLKDLVVVSTVQLDSYAALLTEATAISGDIGANVSPTSSNDVHNNARSITGADSGPYIQRVANADTDPKASTMSDLDIKRDNISMREAVSQPNTSPSINADIDTKMPAAADAGLDLSRRMLLDSLGKELVRARLQTQKHFSLLVELSSNLHETASKSTAALLRADASRYIKEHLVARDRSELHPVVLTCFEAFEALDADIQTFYRNIDSEVPFTSALGKDLDKAIPHKVPACILQRRPLPQMCAELVDCLSSPHYKEYELYQLQLWQMTQRPNIFFNLPESLPGEKLVSEMKFATAARTSSSSTKHPVVAVVQRNVVLRMARNIILAKRKNRLEGTEKSSRKKRSKSGACSKKMIEHAFTRSFSPTHPIVRRRRTQHLGAFAHLLASFIEGSATAWSPPRDNEGTFACVIKQTSPRDNGNHESDGADGSESANDVSSQFGNTLLPWYYTDSICALMQVSLDTHLYIGSYENGVFVELDEKSKRRYRVSDDMMRDQLLPIPHSLLQLNKLLKFGTDDDEHIADTQLDFQTLKSHLDGPIIDKNDAGLWAQLLALQVVWVQASAESRWPSAQFLSRCHFEAKADLRHLVKYLRGVLANLRTAYTWKLFNFKSNPFKAVAHNRSVRVMLQDECMCELWKQALVVIQLFFRISTLDNDSIPSAFKSVATKVTPQEKRMVLMMTIGLQDLRDLSQTSIEDFSAGNIESILENLTSLYVSVESGRLQARILNVIDRFLDHPFTKELRFGSTQKVRRYYRALVNRLIDDHSRFGAGMMPPAFDRINGGLTVLAATELLRNIAIKSMRYFTKLAENSGGGNDSMFEWKGKWNELARIILVRMQEMLSIKTRVRSFTQLVHELSSQRQLLPPLSESNDTFVEFACTVLCLLALVPLNCFLFARCCEQYVLKAQTDFLQFLAAERVGTHPTHQVGSFALTNYFPQQLASIGTLLEQTRARFSPAQSMRLVALLPVENMIAGHNLAFLLSIVKDTIAYYSGDARVAKRGASVLRPDSYFMHRLLRRLYMLSLMASAWLPVGVQKPQKPRPDDSQRAVMPRITLCDTRGVRGRTHIVLGMIELNRRYKTAKLSFGTSGTSQKQRYPDQEQKSTQVGNSRLSPHTRLPLSRVHRTSPKPKARHDSVCTRMHAIAGWSKRQQYR